MGVYIFIKLGIVPFLCPIKKADRRGLRAVDGFVIYIDMDFEYFSQLSPTFNSTDDKPIIITHATCRRRD